jgi:hypothetical protein
MKLEMYTQFLCKNQLGKRWLRAIKLKANITKDLKTEIILKRILTDCEMVNEIKQGAKLTTG